MRSHFRLFIRTLAVTGLALSGLTLVSFVPTSAIGGTGSDASNVSPSVTPVRPLSGVKILGWGFNDPVAIASGSTHVWVANYDGNSVTEFSASTGALVKLISGSRYGFNGPDAIALDGNHVWVTNSMATRSPSSRPRLAPWSR